MAPSLPHVARDDGGDLRSSTKPRVKVIILCNSDAKVRAAGAASAGTTGETAGSSGRINIMQMADDIAHRLRTNDYDGAGVPRTSSIDATTTMTTRRRPEAAASVEVSIRVMVGGGGERLLSLLRQQEERIGGDDPTVFGIMSACGDDVAGGREDRWAAGIVETLSAHSPWPYVVLPAGGETTSDDNGAGGVAADAALRLARLCGLVDPLVRSAVSTELRRRREETLVADATVKTTSAYLPLIRARYDSGTKITGDRVYRDGDLPAGMRRIRGKVRDRYEVVNDDEKKDSDQPIALVTTDRQSGFDRMLALVPCKGKVLNLTSAYWFERTRHLVPNHLLAVPHPNVSIVRRCKPFPIEFVVRAYMTGSTSTSIWKNYQDGVRRYCGHDIPDGMRKNEKLARVIVTPTTKEEDHDRPISAEDIVSEGWMTQDDFDICSAAALRLFEFGQRVAAERGLILVDTKYEMGRDLSSGGGCSGDIMVIDEMHTPDSSRYWLASSYEQRMAAGLEPENIDKEFLRLWFRDNCDPYVDDVLPEAPRDLVCELSRRYISLYEMITWREFEFDDAAETEIADVVATFLKQPIT